MKTTMLLFCLLLSFVIKAQHDHFNCGSHHKEAELQKLHPEIIKAYEDMRSLGSELLKNGDTTLIIPIVFHVVHNYGSENISDEQIYRQVEILNEDFMKLNADTADVVLEFVDLVGKVNIQFELARFDPFGQCSNGINRYHSFETTQGDDYSKLNPWPRTRYLNVWVVDKMEDGVAGYAYFPSSVEGTGFWRDGIIILHNYIGDTGTGNPSRSRALTHEIGHWLGLAHPWGPTNDPEELSNCLFDDGIEDTPNTVGWTTCNLQGTTCDEALDNVQNFMEYSYCSNMFTIGQSEFMRAILNSNLSGRNALWDEDNLALTLGDLNQTVDCEPVADFHAPTKTVCLNTPVTFRNHSWRTKGAVSYFWEFPTGTPATSTSENPSVSWNTDGWKKVKLTVTDSQGTHVKSEEQYIFVSPEWRDYVGPTQLNFDENPASYIIHNPTNNEAKWQIQDGVGIGGSKAIILRNTSPYTNFLPFTHEAFYTNRVGGSIDEFTTPSFDLSNTSNVTVSFRYAAATNANTLSAIEEELRVFTSTNCGQTWIPRQTLSGMTLINNGSGHPDFVPNQQTVWGESSFVLNTNENSDNVRIRFQYIASDLSNNIVIDNININGILGLGEANPLQQIAVYPNPVSAQESIYFDMPTDVEVEQIQILDNLGKVVAILPKSELGESKINLNEYHNFVGGVYYLSISNATHAHVIKIVVY